MQSCDTTELRKQFSWTSSAKTLRPVLKAMKGRKNDKFVELFLRLSGIFNADSLRF